MRQDKTNTLSSDPAYRRWLETTVRDALSYGNDPARVLRNALAQMPAGNPNAGYCNKDEKYLPLLFQFIHHARTDCIHALLDNLAINPNYLMPLSPNPHYWVKPLEYAILHAVQDNSPSAINRHRVITCLVERGADINDAHIGKVCAWFSRHASTLAVIDTLLSCPQMNADTRTHFTRWKKLWADGAHTTTQGLDMTEKGYARNYLAAEWSCTANPRITLVSRRGVFSPLFKPKKPACP